MLISKKWLQSYFVQELPSAQEIADILMMHSFEIEGVSQVSDDWVIDIDVLPNRAHDCLCHQGVAYELAGLLNLELQKNRSTPSDTIIKKSDQSVSVLVKNPHQCNRYMATRVTGIQVHESPLWLKDRLLSMGQKPINALVDATNYIMFDMGQPLHVFDADKIVGGIIVRNAEPHETITTLSGETIELLETDLVISDEVGILALAGVKGGIRAGVTHETKNIIIESANFHGTTTRSTARRVKIITDASKRYENEITAEKVAYATDCMISLLYDIARTDDTDIYESTDVYSNPETVYTLDFTMDHVARLLGFPLSQQDISGILDRFHYIYSINRDTYTVTIPFDRLDLRIPEDMIEEIGRLYGYHNIPTQSLTDIISEPQVNPSFYTAHRLRNYFIEQGFTEIMNYTFVRSGDVLVMNPLASDKKALRKDLSTQMLEAMEKNVRLVDFVHTVQLKNFEIDTVHTVTGEQVTCCFGINALSKNIRKKFGDESSQIDVIISDICRIFSIDTLEYTQEGNIVSFTLEQLYTSHHTSYGDILQITSYSPETQFIGISAYPYIKRDISFWSSHDDVSIFADAIRNSGAVFLLTHKVFLFDTFQKDGKTSYAFALFFQSRERTLTDSDVDTDMQSLSKAITGLGAEIR